MLLPAIFLLLASPSAPAPPQEMPSYFVTMRQPRTLFSKDEPVTVILRMGNQQDRALRAKKWPDLIGNLTVTSEGKTLKPDKKAPPLFKSRDSLDINAHKDFRINLRRYFPEMQAGKVYEIRYEDKFNEVDGKKVSIVNFKRPDATKDFLVKTSMGDITLRLEPDHAPHHSKNFALLVDMQFFKDMFWHRVVEGFVIQSGDPTGSGTSGSPYSMELEVTPFLKHNKYAVGMARSQAMDSGNSQFYICAEAAPDLDKLYTVFGRVVAGFEVVDAISKVKTNGPSGEPPNKPLEPVKLISITAVDPQ